MRRAQMMITLCDIPCELIAIILNFVHRPSDQRATALTCHAFDNELRTRMWRCVNIRTGCMFKCTNVLRHYSQDLSALYKQLCAPRFSSLRRLVLTVDSPSFMLTHNRCCRARRFIPPRVNTVIDLTIDARVIPNFQNKLSLSVVAVGCLLRSFQYLKSLSLCNLNNLCTQNMEAIRYMPHLRNLALCSCSFNNELRREWDRNVDGGLLPPFLVHLMFDVTNVSTSFLKAAMQHPPILAFSRLQSLRSINLSHKASWALWMDGWYALIVLQALKKLNTISTDSGHVYLCARTLQEIDPQLQYTVRWNRVHEV